MLKFSLFANIMFCKQNHVIMSMKISTIFVIISFFTKHDINVYMAAEVLTNKLYNQIANES